MTDKILEKYRQQIFQETDGSKFSKLIKKLIKKHSFSDRENVLKILTDYSKNGQILHWRNFLLTDIIDLINKDDRNYEVFFEWCVTQPDLTYWGIDGLLKTKGKKAYPTLIELAMNDNLEISIRAKSIKSISIQSKQLFDRALPDDPGYWKIEDLRMDEVKKWQENGYPDGEGYNKPTTHNSLENPKSELEKVVAKLDKNLEKERNKVQDLSTPTNWLVIADETDILSIQTKWKLPENYLLFLKNYSPLRVLIENKKFFQGLNLYGASELIERQGGYSFNPITCEIIEDWPKNFVVIADAGADPYCIDINNIKGNDAPIYKSMHGEGDWKFKLYADSFLTFLNKIS